MFYEPTEEDIDLYENCRPFLAELKTIVTYHDLLKISPEALCAIKAVEESFVSSLREDHEGSDGGHSTEIFALLEKAQKKARFESLFKCWIYVDESTGELNWHRLQNVIHYLQTPSLQ